VASINPHQILLEQRLAEGGWAVDERYESDLWWIAAIWSVRSTRRPRALVLFLVDPQARSGALPESVVWAVAASSTIPREQGTPWPALLPLGRCWERGIDEFLIALAGLRDAVASGAG